MKAIKKIKDLCKDSKGILSSYKMYLFLCYRAVNDSQLYIDCVYTFVPHISGKKIDQFSIC